MFETALDPPQLDDAALIEAILAWERLAARAAAGQLAAVAELARRRPRDLADAPPGHADAGHPGLPQVSEFAVDELAAALRLSRPAAGARLALAVELTRLPATAEALSRGDLDVPRARAVAEAVSPLDAGTAALVEDRVLPRAAGQTVGQLRASLSRAVLAADPAGAERRLAWARSCRRVTVTPHPDGMAELWALLPAEGAAAVSAAIDALARSAPAGDPRTADERRADALVDLVVSGASLGGDTGLRAQVHVTVPVATALGLGEEPGELAGHGPVPASVARRLAGGGTWRKVTVDPATGTVLDVGRDSYAPSAALADLVRARDRTCRFPGCRQPARRCDLDHVVPWPAGSTSAANLAALCRHHHRLKHQTAWRVAADGGGLTWTSPAGHRYRVGVPDP